MYMILGKKFEFFKVLIFYEFFEVEDYYLLRGLVKEYYGIIDIEGELDVSKLWMWKGILMFFSLVDCFFRLVFGKELNVFVGFF